MIYTLLVLASPASGNTARTACKFAEAVLARGHSISRVFFLGEGVLNGNANSVFPQDENNPVAEWADLHERHAVELVLCISSALKGGVLDATEADRQERPGANAHPAFIISGLGQLIDASARSDRLVTFGG